MNAIVHSPASGTLSGFPLAERNVDGERVSIDLDASVGDTVDGPDRVFSTVLAEVTVIAAGLKHARELVAGLLSDPPLVASS